MNPKLLASLNWKQLYRVSFFLICLATCLYEIIKICEIYFSYKTTTFVEYENISIISLPAITICVDKREVLSDNAVQNLTQSVANLSDDKKDEFLAKLSIRDQFRALHNSSHIIKRCQLVKTIPFKNEPGVYIDCERITEIKRSIDYHR